MKNRYITIFVSAIVVGILSLVPTWNFNERLRISDATNPLWNSDLVPIDSALTRALQEEGLTFYTERGAEADPDGICFGDFGSDEYWVVQYDSTRNEVDARAWIIEINWIGHIIAERRFSRIRKILQDKLNNKKQNKSEQATPRKPSD